MNFPVRVRAVMIDLDGTLLDTVSDLAVAANGMLRELGRAEVDEATVRRYVGRGIPALVKRCLAGRLEAADDPAPPPEEALSSFKRHYADSNGRHSTIFPGVLAGLGALKAKGLPLACITNKSEAFTRPLLERTGLAPWFVEVVSGDSLPRSKPDPLPLTHVCQRFGITPSEAILIGDSINDVRAARAAGCPVFCVPYGYNEGAGVRQLDCDAIVATLADAADLIAAA